MNDTPKKSRGAVRSLNSFLALFILVMVLVFLFFQLFLIKVDVGQRGVRTLQYGLLGEKGLEQKDFGPGWHRDLPIIDNWSLFDSTVQTLEFATSQERERTRRSMYAYFRKEDLPAHQSAYGNDRVELKSREGFNVLLDVTVKFRIEDGQVHKLYRDTGQDPAYKKFVANEASDTLRFVFGQLGTEEFYNPSIRSQKTIEAEELLASKLEPRYVELIAILIRDIEFDESYERKILDKKLADQDVELNRSKTLAEEVRGETNKILEETEAKVRVIEEELKADKIRLEAGTRKEVAQIEADAELEVAKLRAGADLYAAEREAEGDLLERKAEAEGERLRAQALSGSGGANLVALEAVRKLQLGDMSISTMHTDFLDIEGIIRAFGAQP